MDTLKEYILATRPWSFTAAVVPILVTAAVCNSDFLSTEFLRCLAIGVAVQAGANLTNTYYDFVNGVDSKDTPCGEKTLVDAKVSDTGLLYLSFLFYAVGIIAIFPLVTAGDDHKLLYISASGILLAYFYTATPVGLKYMALGDITIFLCFGPLLMECASLVLTGKLNYVLCVYSIPIGLLTEAILHANNARDIKADTLANAKTLATLVGFENSYYIFVGLLVSTYTSIIGISLYLNWGCLLTLISIPLAIGLEKQFREKKVFRLM